MLTLVPGSCAPLGAGTAPEPLREEGGEGKEGAAWNPSLLLPVDIPSPAGGSDPSLRLLPGSSHLSLARLSQAVSQPWMLPEVREGAGAEPGTAPPVPARGAAPAALKCKINPQFVDCELP